MSKPRPDEKGQDSFSRLDADLASFETRRRRTSAGAGEGAGVGYQMLGQMLSGVLGGLGLGWLVDHYAHTSPWGLVLGLLIGAVLSIYSTVRLASRMGSGAKPGLGVPAPDDDDD